MRRDSIANTVIVAMLLCIACSVLVSGAAVVLRRKQEQNQVQERRRNILKAAGLYDAETPLDDLFVRVQPRVFDLESGELVDDAEIDIDSYDPQAAAKDPERSFPVPAEDDIAGIRRQPKYTIVYEVFATAEKKQLEKVVLPIEGKGLWSTLYGYLAVDAEDGSTIRGITFDQHGETPGLGGEVDNPTWQASWDGKQAFDESGEPEIEVLKGQVPPDSPDADHQVDGLAGATITARGVGNLVRFWLGSDGFGPYLQLLGKPA